MTLGFAPPVRALDLTARDFEALASSGITVEIAAQARLFRVETLGGGELVKRNGAGDYAGLVFPYMRPGQSSPHEYRLRRDKPDLERDSEGNLKEKGKYLSPPGRGNNVYFVPGMPPEWLADTSLPIIITEGEKKCLSLWGIGWHGLNAIDAPRYMPIGLPGVWNWKGTIGKTNGPQGERRDVKGVVPDINKITWTNRRVTIVFDANVASNDSVAAARAMLARELASRGAHVFIVDLPTDVEGVNGIDDLLVAWGTERTLQLLDSAVPFGNGRTGWEALLIMTAKSGPKPILANTITALRNAPEWHGVLGFNEFSLQTQVLSPTPWGASAGTPWTDHEDRLTTDWLQHRSIVISVETAGQAVQTVARERSYHPVRQYLDGLQWDGTPRLDEWLATYAGVESTPYTRAVGSRWMISAVARVYKPGAKADCCLILEGGQGTLKSTLLKKIAGDWFTDEIADLGSKDAAMQTLGVWIIEIAELDSLSRAEVGKIKAFMSRAVDRFRPPYGKRLIESPRQCIFAGSVNHSTYLRDETGARRFWPVACGTIDILAVECDRDQLWAEAAERYRGGAPWWIDSLDLAKEAAREQSDRYEGDPWDEPIIEWLKAPAERLDAQGHPVAEFGSTPTSVSVSDVLNHCIGKRQEFWTQVDKNRVARSLRAHGWVRFNASLDDGGREWRYRHD